MKAKKGAKLETEEANRWWKLEERRSSQRFEVSAEKDIWWIRGASGGGKKGLKEERNS